MASNWDRLDQNLRESVQENVELYERVRPALKLVTREVLLSLRSMLKGTEVTPLFVTGRTKTVESFREKISRTEEPLEPGGPPVLKFPDPFRTLNDMVGIRVITKLPAAQAEALLMHVALEYSIAEVAAISDVSVDTIKTRLKLGKDSLRRRIERDSALRSILGGRP